MENQLIKLNDLLSKKEYYTFLITGKDDDGDGVLIQKLNHEYRLNENANHTITLTDFVGWSNFPNVDRTNNKFYYKTSNTGVLKTLTIPFGSYGVEDYNFEVKKLITANGDNADNVNIAGSTTQLKSIITIKDGYQVLFNQLNSWRQRLGFNAVDSTALQQAKLDLKTNGEHISQNNVNITDVQLILIHCSLSTGYNINGKVSNVIYSIPNNITPGSMIGIKDNKKIHTYMNTKQFSEIRIWFTDQNLNPINFNRETVSVELYIKQV